MSEALEFGKIQPQKAIHQELALNKKQPRDRVISAKISNKHEKLPPPPFGKTMGHGLLDK